ncbi:uncharacterized protein LOC126893537 [Daktulosphaira vitifoliae]|uniref:uncharacterized protein LOC126893537 n=1 Tax=Daktulosphaira vitifoliae TaxID=58002 RepID=UPI0021AA74C4|nr:uncharacterized protein LOC126893537 [Daktulosphaira vitifoliae]
MDYFLTAKRKILKCSIKNCKSLEVDPALVSHFSFPKDPSRCEVWIDKCGLSHLKGIDAAVLNKNYRLCSLHFENCMFRNEKQNRLRPDAIPTLFEDALLNKEEQAVKTIADNDNETVECLPSCSTPDTSSAYSTISVSDVSTSTSVEMSSTHCQTPSSLTDLTPRKMSLRKELFAETKRRKELESVISCNPELAEDYSIMTCLKVCEKYCSPTICLLVKSQIENKNRKPKGYRYSNEIK